MDSNKERAAGCLASVGLHSRCTLLPDPAIQKPTSMRGYPKPVGCRRVHVRIGTDYTWQAFDRGCWDKDVVVLRVARGSCPPARAPGASYFVTRAWQPSLVMGTHWPKSGRGKSFLQRDGAAGLTCVLPRITLAGDIAAAAASLGRLRSSPEISDCRGDPSRRTVLDATGGRAQRFALEPQSPL